MRRIFYLGILLFLFLMYGVTTIYAGPGDTITVQTFTFGSSQNAKFLFPDASHKFSKILMYYTLKCNPAQNPACGEWDYLSFNYLYEHTGKIDSTLYSHANYTIDGTTPDSLMLMKQPSWNYFPRKEYIDTANYTGPVDSARIGSVLYGTSSLFIGQGGKEFIVWRPGELASHGLKAGIITSLRFCVGNIINNPFMVENLKLKFAQSSSDDLDHSHLSQLSFEEVYSRNTLIPAVPPINKWFELKFYKPFLYDGISNIIIEISYTKSDYATMLCVENIYPGSVTASVGDYYLSFNGSDYVDPPLNGFNTIDSAITIAFWQYGDTALQPRQQSIFEALDSNGNRVLNSHLPWSDANIYWDAGNNGGTYDRISKKADSSSYFKGKWNFWVFTKDVKSGTMKIYLNGVLWATGTGKTLRMKNIKKFKIGSGGNGSLGYAGFIDDFSVWNVALDSATITHIMFNTSNTADPNWGNLVACYNFNDGYDNLLTKNISSYGGEAKLMGMPEWKNFKGSEIFKNFYPAKDNTLRPWVVFVQGNFDTADVKSRIVIDKEPKKRVMVVLFNDTKHPANPTDTIYPWLSYYTYHFNSAGIKLDSTLVIPDTVLHKVITPYYGAPFEVVNTYELGRYITPYGNNLDLGNGFTWIYDVTDYAPLLHDSVHLSGGNWQEFLDMKFVMIVGTPPRDVKKVSTIYQGIVGFNANAENTLLVPKKFFIPADVKMARVKMRVTGHGMQGSENCAEFCPKTHILKINDVKRFDHYVWRGDCSLNPLYPQGGTWIFSRSNWCPGAEVRTADFEITPFITPGDSVKVDYDFQPYSSGGSPDYVVVGQLVTYGDYNFNLDASMDEIISPNNMQLFLRENPICGEPKIVFSNNGKTDLTSLDIAYGAVGGNTAAYHWTGNLKFGQKDTLVLPSFDWGIWTGVNIFKVQISNPNGGTDEYSYNNIAYSRFNIPPVMSNKLVLYLNTNHAASETSYTIEDDKGNIVKSRSTFANNTLYKDTIILHDGYGCYTFRLKDAGDDGLKFWYNMPPYGTGTAGYCRFRNLGGSYFPAFQPDFGREIIYNFTTNFGLDIKMNKQTDDTYSLDLYPNPANERIYADIHIPGRQNVRINIYDMYGRLVNSSVIKNFISDVVEISLADIPAGVYYCSLFTGKEVITKKFVVAR